MMKKKLSWKKLTALGMGAVTALSLAFGLGFSNLSLNGADDSADSDLIQNVEGGGINSVASTYATSTSNLNYDSTAKLHYFNNGDTYWYIDYASGVKFGNGDASVSTDIIEVTVKSGSTKGTKENPYVIDSKDDWDNFVTYTKTAANQTKTYVLNADLDFAETDDDGNVTNGEIESVSTFSGNFYGTGHRISNATYVASNSLNNFMLGLFCRTTGTIYISDLIIENVISNSAVGHVGGLVGHSDGNLTVANVNVTGSLTASKPTPSNTAHKDLCTQSPYISYGGILGAGNSANVTMNFYKCATDVDIIIDNTGNTTTANRVYVGAGGLIGVYEGLNGTMAALNVYDCYSALDLEYSGNDYTQQLWSGIVGFLRCVKVSTFKRCLAVHNVKASTASKDMSPGIIFTIGENNNTSVTDVFNVENCYGYGNFEQGTTKKALPFIGRYSQTGKLSYNVKNCLTYSDYLSNDFYTNVNRDTSKGTASASEATNNAPASDTNDLKISAKGALNNSEIWASDVIDKITAGSKPNIAQSPIIINRLRIAYYEYKKVGANLEDVPYANAYGVGETAGDWKKVAIGDMLAQPDYEAGQVPAGRIFLGWTNDKTGKSDPYIIVPNTWHGDNKIYAVWGISNAAGVNADISLSARNGNVSLTYDEGDAETAAKGYNIVYNSYGITLTASNSNLTVTGTDKNDFAGYEYIWMKRDETTGNYEEKSVGTTNTYTVSNVKDSGNYKLTVKYRSASEPLFMGEIETDAKKVTINKAPLKCTGVTFNGNKPYSLAPFSEVTPTATVTLASGGKTIPGTTEWVESYGYINNTYKATNVKDGKEKKWIRFTPTGDYADNYGTDGDTGALFEIEFEIQYLQLIFDIKGSGTGSNVAGQLEYDQNYSYNAIADKFEEAFKSLMDLLDGDSPVFIMDNGDAKTIEDYRKLSSSNGNYNAYEHVKDDVTIQVQFRPIEYTVSFDLNGGNMGEDPSTGELRTSIADQTYHYGNHLSSLPNPQNGNQLFLGWYYDVEEKNESGQTVTVPTAWNFDSDRVTKSMSLYARWLAAEKLDKLEVEFTADAVFKAGEPVTPNMLTVKATFIGTENEGTENEITHKLTSILSCGEIQESGKYWIVYENANASALHVKLDSEGNPLKSSIFVRYNFGGETHEAESPKFDIERIRLNTSLLKPYFPDSTFEYAENTPRTIAIKNNTLWDKLHQDANGEFDALGIVSEENVSYAYLNGSEKEIAATDVVKSGTYTVIAKFTLDPEHADYYAPEIRATLRIVPEKYALKVEWDNTEFEYNGTVQIPKPTFKLVDKTQEDESLWEIVPSVQYQIVDHHGASCSHDCVNAKRVGTTYSIHLTLLDTGYKLVSGNNYDEEVEYVSVNFTIAQAKIAKPEQIEDLKYRGTEYDLTALTAEEYARYFKGLDPNIVDIGEGAQRTNAGTYTTVISLKEPTCATWDDGTTDDIRLTWNIKRAVLMADWGSDRKFEVDDDLPKVTYFYGLQGDDRTKINWETDFSYKGDMDMSAPGGHTITLSFKNNPEWAKNYELDDSKSFTFVVLPEGADDDVTLVYVKWGTTKLTYDGTAQTPTFQLINYDDQTDDLTDLLLADVRYEGGDEVWAGTYSVTLSLDNEQYVLVKNQTCTYTISKAADGSGEKPATVDNKPDDGTVTGLPLWQLIVGGVSALLFVFCTLKSFGEYGKLKAAKKEGKELAAQSYYGIVPLPLLAVGPFLGMAESSWTIIALVAAGLFLISAVMLFVLSKKRKAAELVVKREQARIADEKEYAREEERREEQARRDEENRRRDEEQARRDNEMRMMFAAMQQGGYGQASFQYDDMRSMLAETMQALLPAAMQQMQALPPAQSDTSGYIQPGYVSPEAELLRAQMAQQQEMMARQEERMARQEELINQLLQNQAAQQAAPAYDYEEEPVDDISWLGESEEVVSLEESYGALSDEEKRAYYDIGSYIMSKPQISQNDGRYAVLFKYRGRTLFKLAIKDGAPVLYYPLNGGRGEVSIADSASLETAKSMIDRSVSMIDSQLN